MGRVQTIDATGDRRLQGIGQGNCLEIIDPLGQMAFLVFNDKHARIAQGIGQFLGKEGMSFGFLADQFAHLARHRFDAQTLAHQRFDIVERHHVQLHEFGLGALRQFLELGRHGR